MPQTKRDRRGRFVSNGRYGGLYNPLALNYLRDLHENAATIRRRLVDNALDPRRNIDDECGYPRTDQLQSSHYREMYDRNPVAARVVEVLPAESWTVTPSVFDDEDPGTVTPFEQAWEDLNQRLHGPSWFKQEQGSPIWEYLYRADVLSGIGRYGVLLLGVDDGKELNQPIDGVAERYLAIAGGQPPTTTAPVPQRQLLYLRAFDESLASIVSYEHNTASPRFGQPIMYDITFNDPREEAVSTGVGHSSVVRRVHWTRIIHLADNLSSSEVFGVPRQRPVFNNLYDLRKLYGGSGEMYWRGAFPGLSFETHPQLGGDVVIDQAGFRDQMEKYMTGLQRYFSLTGMSAKSLAPQVVDPSKQIGAAIDAVCIKLGIPKRIFIGSERGELASSQDTDTWNNRLRRRQNGYLTPRVISPLIDRLILIGVLPVPQEGYSAVWPDLESVTDAQVADIAVKRTEAMAKYVAGNVEALMVPLDYLVRVLGMTEEDAQATIDNATQSLELELEDTQQQGIIEAEGEDGEPT